MLTPKGSGKVLSQLGFRNFLNLKNEGPGLNRGFFVSILLLYDLGSN